MNSVKIFLGNVYLTIPAVFSKTGLIGGIILYSTIALLNTYTMGLILWMGTRISRQRNEKGEYKLVHNYSELS